MITSLDYFQKSRNLLFPLLGIPTNIISVENTYLFWDGFDGIDNYELIVVYGEESIKSSYFKEFEEKYIVGNENIIGCYNIRGGVAYIFDMYPYCDCVNKFLEGKYSTYSKECKEAILYNSGFKTIPTKKVESNGVIKTTAHIALYPEMYYDDAAKELGYDNKKFLVDCRELWSKYNEDKETLKNSVVSERCSLEKDLINI